MICILATATLGIFSASAADPAPKTYEGWVEGYGTPIFSNFEGVNNGDPIDYIVTNKKGISTSGGAQDYRVINDGATIDNIYVNGTKTWTRHAFDSYIPAFKGVKRTEWFGYEFSQSFNVKKLQYQQGTIDADYAGHFTTLWVEAKVNGAWTKVDSNVTDVYKQNGVKADFSNYQIFNIELTKAVACDGIRLIGETGSYTSVVELKVWAVDIQLADSCIERISTPFVGYFPVKNFTKSNNGGTGGSNSAGSFTLRTICDGITDASAKSYDNHFDNKTTLHNIGYTFPSSFTVEKIMYQNGAVWAAGGYFTDVAVEALIDGQWVEVASDIDAVYPQGDNRPTAMAEYTITLTRPVTCDGIRLNGAGGGAISCNEFKVYTTEAHENNLKYTQENAPVNNTYDVRLISVLDRTDYDKAGFEIKTVAGDKTNTVTKDIKNVYTAVLADGKTYTADAGTYFAILTLEDIPTGIGKVTFVVTPYCVENGVTYYGGAVTVTYDNGVLVTA